MWIVYNKKTATLAQDGINFDLQIRQCAQTPEQWERLYDSIQKVDKITELSEIKSAFLNATATKEQLPKELQENLIELGEETFRYFINLMIHYESIFYGLKALIYGIPLSIGVMLLMFYSLQHSFSYKFELPWLNLVAVVIGIFIIIGSAMLYASSKVKKANIIDALKQENI